MKRAHLLVLAMAAAATVLALTGCGQANDQPTLLAQTSTTPSPSVDQTAEQHPHMTQPIALPTDCPHKSSSPHFDTPQAMMRYLAAAWNRNDLDAMCHVTNPNARLLLIDMHKQATNLRLDHCTRSEDGHYECVLLHGYPATLKHHPNHVGHAYLQAAPAETPGWYMTIYEGCGG